MRAHSTPTSISFIEKGYQQNFYLPHCGTNGITGVRGYNRILYPQVYAGIDMWVYSGALGQKMMFVIAPGSSPAAVQMQFAGQDNMDVDVNGWLRMQVDNKWFALPEAVAYQYDQNNVITPVTWGPTYLPNTGNGVVGFQFEQYDPSKPLVLLIGPPPAGGGGTYDESGLCWSTYYGGDAYDYLYDSAKDLAGNYFICGASVSTASSFPFEIGVTTYGASVGSVIAGFNAGDQIQWQTLVGGDFGTETRAYSCAVQASTVSNLLITGGRTTTDFLPILSNNIAHYETVPSGGWLGGFEMVFGHRIWLTYMAGRGIDAVGTGPNGRAYFVGRTAFETLVPDISPPPTGSTFWQNATPATMDGVVGMLNIYDQLWWHTYIPTPLGTPDVTQGVSSGALDVGSDKLIVTFGTDDPETQLVGTGNYELFHGAWGSNDLVIYEFDLNGHANWSTFHGDIGWEWGTTADNNYNNVAIDPTTGDFVVTGYTTSTSMPWPNVGWRDHVYSSNGSSTAFATRFNGTTHLPQWGTYMDGTDPTDASFWMNCAFGMDGMLYLGGHRLGNSIDLFDAGGYYHEETVMLNAGQYPNDGFIAAVSPDLHLVWSTLIGGIGGANIESPTSILDKDGNGNIYVCGNTSKVVGAYDSYFPLDDQGGASIVWDYGGGYSDGYIAKFCSELGTTVVEQMHGQETLTATLAGEGYLLIPTHGRFREPYTIIGLDGRLIQKGFLQAEAGTDHARLSILQLASGTYFVRTSMDFDLFIKP